MRVRMTTIECGPAGNFQPGDEREVSAEHGRALVAGNHAVDVSPCVMEQAVLLPELTVPLRAEVTAPKKPENRKKQANK